MKLNDRTFTLLLLAGGAAAVLWYLSRPGSGDVQAPDGSSAVYGPQIAPMNFTAVNTGSPILDAIEGAWHEVFPMNISDAGAAFIKQQEGCSLTAYQDAGGYSIGYGHYITGADGLVSAPDTTIDQATADSLFDQDIAAVVAAINRVVTVPLSQNQFDALCDFAYNVGTAAFGKSTLLRDLNAQDYQAASDQFRLWNHSGGQVLASLTQRRTADASLFMTA